MTITLLARSGLESSMLADGERWKIVEGDALEVLRGMEPGCVDAVVTDPPFGMDWNTDSSRFTKGKGYHNKRSPRIVGDSDPFDPTPWLAFQKVALWGSNHYANRLPTGVALVWLKKGAGKFGKFLSDCEIGWHSGGHGAYAFHHVWDGCARESENGLHLHPTQKPVALMAWIMERLKVPSDAVVFDPYCGSGSTGVACLQTGRRFIGVEINPEYAAIARRRLTAADDARMGTLFA